MCLIQVEMINKTLELLIRNFFFYVKNSNFILKLETLTFCCRDLKVPKLLAKY